MRLRIFYGYQMPVLDIQVGEDKVDLLIEAEEVRDGDSTSAWMEKWTIEWRGTLAELAKALKKDKEERGDG